MTVLTRSNLRANQCPRLNSSGIGPTSGGSGMSTSTDHWITLPLRILHPQREHRRPSSHARERSTTADDTHKELEPSYLFHGVVSAVFVQIISIVFCLLRLIFSESCVILISVSLLYGRFLLRFGHSDQS